MDVYEATKVVFSRIQNLDPVNASKIIGLLLIQDHGQNEMIRLALGPEALLHSVILKARKDLELLSNTQFTPSSPASVSPYLFGNNAIPISRQNSSRLVNRTGINLPPSLTIPNHAPGSGSPSWASINTDDLVSPNGLIFGSSASPIISSSPFQQQDHLRFMNNSLSTAGSETPDWHYPISNISSCPIDARDDPMLFHSFSGSWGGPVHRRSCSTNDICLGSKDPNIGVGLKPSLSISGGYCRKGTSCRFLQAHEDEDATSLIGYPDKIAMMDQYCGLLKSKSQQQRLDTCCQLFGTSFPHSPQNKNFLRQQQLGETRRGAEAFLISEDLDKFGRSWLESNEFLLNGGAGMVNSAMRQIYLTFPADSSFRDEDVANYFSIYGHVQDVRIPYQDKRMFGFVTFVYPETVKLVLAKGNPHFICDSRVLVKPYKEKGKAHDKFRKRQQVQVEMDEISPFGTPTGLDARDPYDVSFEARMCYNSQDMPWRGKHEEQADLQQALETQNQRMMGLHLIDIKNHEQELSTCNTFPSPEKSPDTCNQSIVLPSFLGGSEVLEESGSGSAVTSTISASINLQPLQRAGNIAAQKEITVGSQEENGLHEHLENNLPDGPNASSTKATEDCKTSFSNGASQSGDIDASPTSASVNNKFASRILPSTSGLMEESFKPFDAKCPESQAQAKATTIYEPL